MKKILFKGYFSKNLGDDLLFYCLMKRYNNEFYTYDAGKYTPLSSFRNFNGKKNIFVKGINYFLEKYLGKYDFFYEKNIDKYSVFINIGGSIFMEKENYQSVFNKKIYLKNKKNYILGSNIGPVNSPNFLDYLKNNIFINCDDISLRDKKSFNYIRELKNVRVNPDIIFDIKNYIKLPEIKGEGVLFSIIDISSRKFNIDKDTYVNHLSNLIEEVTKSEKVTLMSFCSKEGDELIISEIIERLSKDAKNKTEVYIYEGDILEAVNIINKHETIVGMRFHSIVLGLSLHKKLIPIKYSNKTDNMLSDLDYNSKIYSIDNILCLKAADILYAKRFDKNKMINIEKKARLHFEKLDNILILNKEYSGIKHE